VRCVDEQGEPGDRFERCSASGERWELVESCGLAKCTLEEVEGEVVGCLPSACEGEDCPPRECENGSLRCDPSSGLTLQRCNSAGRFVTVDACVTSVLCRADLGRCLPPACERNEKRCLGQEFQSCRGDRAWFQTTKECAPGQSCDPISGCVAKRCTNNEVRCNGAALERCLDGSWSPQQICATKDLCNAVTGCEAPVCGGTADLYRCQRDNNIIFQCLPGRHDWEEIGTCDAGQTCVEKRPFCVPQL
jgi:hypothetical protein